MKSRALFTPIDIDSWARKEYFEYYFERLKCKYNLSINIDISPLHKCRVEKGYKFFPSFLYVIMRAINENEEFRMSFQDNILGYWEYSHPSYTIFHDDTKTFSDIWSEYNPNFKTFYNTVVTDIKKYQHVKKLKARENQPPNFCPISSLPWLSFTSISQDTYSESDFLFPLIRFGKYWEESGKTWIPLSASVHHAVADGYHTSKLVNDIQKWVNCVEQWML